MVIVLLPKNVSEHGNTDDTKFASVTFGIVGTSHCGIRKTPTSQTPRQPQCNGPTTYKIIK